MVLLDAGVKLRILHLGMARAAAVRVAVSPVGAALVRLAVATRTERLS